MANHFRDKVHHVAYITCIINGVPFFYYNFSTVINFNIFSFFKNFQFLINKKYEFHMNELQMWIFSQSRM
jgi:hypothetical protein